MSQLVAYLDLRLGAHQGYGPEYRWHCPECVDRVGDESSKPKLNVNVAKGVGHCYRCGYAFHSFEQFFRRMNNGKLMLEEARLVRREVQLPVSGSAVLGVRAILDGRESDTVSRLRCVPLPKELCPMTSRFSTVALRYLTDRGVTQDMIERHQIGYCPSGCYAGYLVFPVVQNGEQVYFTTRYAGSTNDGMKSNNPPKAEGVHSKATCLLGHDLAIKHERVAIVEGPFDLMAFGGSAVAIMGKAISDEQVVLLSKMAAAGVREFVVALDQDAAIKAQQTYAKLIGRVPKVSVLTFPSGDPWDNRGDLRKLMRARGELSAIALVSGCYREGTLVKRKRPVAKPVR